MQLRVEFISASLIRFDCNSFMEQGRDSQRVKLGDGEERSQSCASMNMLAKQTTLIKMAH